MSSAAAGQPDVLAAARWYWQEFGWPIFPVCTPTGERTCIQHGLCESPGKVPLVAWRKYQTQLPEAEDIERWWGDPSQPNIGVATGPLSGLVVVDLDGELAQAEANKRGGFDDDSPRALTGRVGGLHVYCQWREDAPRNFVKRAGIDFRGAGGYVLLPPSAHWRGPRYRWQVPPRRGDGLPRLPDFIVDLAAPPTPVDHARVDVAAVLAGVPEGQRDTELWRAACALRAANVPVDMAYLLIEQAAANASPPFDGEIARDKVTRAYRQFEPNPPVTTARLTASGTVPPPPPAPALYTFEEVMRLEIESLRQLVHGILWAGRVHWLFGGPGSGKTVFALLLALGVGGGQPVLGRLTESSGVLLIEEDTPLSIMQDYLEVLGDLHRLTMVERPLYVPQTRGLKLLDQAGYDEVWAHIQAARERGPLGLVVLDAIERLVPSEAFNSRESQWLERLLKACSDAGIAVLAIDHTRKASRNPSDKSEPIDELYGGRTKSALADVMWHVTGNIRTEAQVTCVKFRGDFPASFTLSFSPDTGFTIRGGKVELSDAQQRVYQALHATLAESSSIEYLTTVAGLSRSTAQRALKRLIALDLAERLGNGPATTYRAAPGHQSW